ncbi:MAG: 16S rRNA (uracil(1498)-N(3))-methyltransferase [Myxococcota bacterium]|nr:16S rRNA (uracil(1498)-N(3))-methyltransferase [Myxococcota bacterium]
MTRAPIPNLAPGERRLEGAVVRYLARVLRLRAGDPFVAFDPANGREASALTVWADHDAICVRFGALREGTVRARRDLTWVQGLAKGDKCDAIVRDATELEATRIIVATTKRSVVRLDAARSSGRQERWARIAQEAARQCGRSDPPAIDSPCRWNEALARVPADAARFCLWEGATNPLGPALMHALAREAPLAFACGSEGGLEEEESEEALAGGWQLASLGGLILRTETVAAAVLGAVRVWSGGAG